MAVDVVTQITISASTDVVSAFAGDPTNAPKWYKNIELVEWKTDPPVKVGSKVAFVAHFLGRHLAYTYEITELVPGERLVMRTAEGPFPMETSYTWADIGGATRTTLRNRGEPSGFSKVVAPFMAKVVAPFMASAMRRANRKDLLKLRGLLEGA